MSQFFAIHPRRQARLIQQAVGIIQRGGVWSIQRTPPMRWGVSWAIKKRWSESGGSFARRITTSHWSAVICLSWVPMLESTTRHTDYCAMPRPYTFVLEATRDVPRGWCNPSARLSACGCLIIRTTGPAGGVRRTAHQRDTCITRGRVPAD